MPEYLTGAAKEARIKELFKLRETDPNNTRVRLELNRLLSGGPTAQRATVEEQAAKFIQPSARGRAVSTRSDNDVQDTLFDELEDEVVSV